MPVRALNPATLSPATVAMFDLLADGAWHANDEIIGCGAAAAATAERDEARKVGARVRRKTITKGGEVSDADLIDSGARDLARNRLMIAVRSGRIERDGQQHRMLPTTVSEWASLRPEATGQAGGVGAPKAAASATTLDQASLPAHTGPEIVDLGDGVAAKDRLRKPLIFGGIPEDEGWSLAPITPRDRVHFRTDRELPLAAFRADLPTGATVSLDEGEGLYRVEDACGQADALVDFIRAWCEVHGYKTVGLRPETNLKRRAPKDLPPAYLADLCAHYSPVALKRLQRNMTTIKMHIADPDDVVQQVYEWILKAVAQYDETKSVPFGAFLATQLSKWVHDLNRNAYGRTAADAENKQQKAIAAFVTEHQRRPSERELAAYMGQTVETLRRNSQTVATLKGLRNIESIDLSASDENGAEIPLPDAREAPDDLMSDVDQSLISQALTVSCAPDAAAKGRASQANVLGWVTHYATIWGGQTKTELSAAMNTSMRNMNVYADRSAERMQKALANFMD